MRLLLDEMFDDDLVPVLTALGHAPTHVKQTTYRGSSDEDLVPFARGFDAFVTLDLHRQEAEWLAVHGALVEGGLKVVRVRLLKHLPKTRADILRQVAQSLIRRMDAWTAAIETDTCLITITHLGATVRSRSRAAVLEMLAGRSLGQAPPLRKRKRDPRTD